MLTFFTCLLAPPGGLQMKACTLHHGVCWLTCASAQTQFEDHAYRVLPACSVPVSLSSCCLFISAAQRICSPKAELSKRDYSGISYLTTFPIIHTEPRLALVLINLCAMILTTWSYNFYLHPLHPLHSLHSQLWTPPFFLRACSLHTTALTSYSTGLLCMQQYKLQ